MKPCLKEILQVLNCQAYPIAEESPNHSQPSIPPDGPEISQSLNFLDPSCLTSRMEWCPLLVCFVASSFVFLGAKAGSLLAAPHYPVGVAKGASDSLQKFEQLGSICSEPLCDSSLDPKP